MSTELNPVLPLLIPCLMNQVCIPGKQLMGGQEKIVLHSQDLAGIEPAPNFCSTVSALTAWVQNLSRTLQSPASPHHTHTQICCSLCLFFFLQFDSSLSKQMRTVQRPSRLVLRGLRATSSATPPTGRRRRRGTTPASIAKV